MSGRGRAGEGGLLQLVSGGAVVACCECYIQLYRLKQLFLPLLRDPWEIASGLLAAVAASLAVREFL